VTKGITCAPANGIAGCDGTLTYKPSATGVAGPTNETAFCYQIIVANCACVPLTNVTVSDSLIPSVAGTFPNFLAPGASVTNYFSGSYGVGTFTNTVIANGVSIINSAQITSATNHAVAHVLPVCVSCTTPTLVSSFDVDNNTNDNNVTVVNLGAITPITYTEVITNCGSADLSVALTGLPALVDCATDTNPIVIPNPVFIPAGGSYTIQGCFIFSPTNCPLLTVTVTAKGTVVASTNIPCIYDAHGNPITTATSAGCSGTVQCVVTQAVLCRVTGGGTLEQSNVDQSCISVPTILIPLVNGTGLTLDNVTHGGQLGAPFSHKDCGEVLGNPCIRGQWQHVRHYQGNGNPRDVVTGFHSDASPKGQFDTLNCACLGCCDPTTGAFIPPTTAIGPPRQNDLCNPDDHKICGPEPRPAPANSIIFTGLGSLVPVTDNGSAKQQEQWVVFRVYIEDRSEPGGNHPKGAVEPADIYCFQAWYTGILTSHKPDFSKIDAAFRTALGADSCAFLDALTGGAIPIGTLPSPTVSGMTADIQDCGPLYTGNHQIHPSTAATCTQP
jgi:hypothetical protein